MGGELVMLPTGESDLASEAVDSPGPPELRNQLFFSLAQTTTNPIPFYQHSHFILFDHGSRVQATQADPKG